MNKYLVISYDPDQQQWFYDVVFADDAVTAQERLATLRDYCIDFDVMSMDELENMTRKIRNETREQSEAWLTEIKAEAAMRNGGRMSFLPELKSKFKEQPLPEQSMERKSTQAQKHGKRWHDPGPTRKHAERIYIKYPLLPITEIANILGVSRQVIHDYVKELAEEREKAREEAIVKLKRKEGL